MTVAADTPITGCSGCATTGGRMSCATHGGTMMVGRWPMPQEGRTYDPSEWVMVRKDDLASVLDWAEDMLGTWPRNPWKARSNPAHSEEIASVSAPSAVSRG